MVQNGKKVVRTGTRETQERAGCKGKVKGKKMHSSPSSYVHVIKHCIDPLQQRMAISSLRIR